MQHWPDSFRRLCAAVSGDGTYRLPPLTNVRELVSHALTASRCCNSMSSWFETSMHHLRCSVPTRRSAALAAAEVLEIMRQSIESRKTALVELALDLIQRLIAHRALAGRVYSINHRRDLGGGGGKGKRRGGGDDDDEEGGPDEGGQLPPQVCSSAR